MTLWGSVTAAASLAKREAIQGHSVVPGSLRTHAPRDDARELGRFAGLTLLRARAGNLTPVIGACAEGQKRARNAAASPVHF